MKIVRIDCFPAFCSERVTVALAYDQCNLERKAEDIDPKPLQMKQGARKAFMDVGRCGSFQALPAVVVASQATSDASGWSFGGLRLSGQKRKNKEAEKLVDSWRPLTEIVLSSFIFESRLNAVFSSC
jgi:hypothetical protein